MGTALLSKATDLSQVFRKLEIPSNSLRKRVFCRLNIPSATTNPSKGLAGYRQVPLKGPIDEKGCKQLTFSMKRIRNSWIFYYLKKM